MTGKREISTLYEIRQTPMRFDQFALVVLDPSTATNRLPTISAREGAVASGGP
jgi:hypothetical protein